MTGVSETGQVETEQVETARRVLLAAPRGYCAGVDRAVEAVEKALDLYGAPVYVRKQIVHNRHVVATLEQRGAVFVDETDAVPEGALVVFSAHGVAPVVHQQAAERGLRTIDATCPLVTKVHKEAIRFAREDYDILLVGHTGHEEVEGTAGEAPQHIQVVNGPDDVASVTVRDPARVVWLSQTTLSVDETMETVRRLRERFPQLADPPSDDICYATQNRQVAVKKIAPECDLVIVVGSSNSSNSVRLVEVALEHGARAAHRVDWAAELDEAWLSDDVTEHCGADVGSVGTRGAGSGRVGLAGRARLRRGAGGPDRRGGPAVLPAPRTAPRPQALRPVIPTRNPTPTCSCSAGDCSCSPEALSGRSQRSMNPSPGEHERGSRARRGWLGECPASCSRCTEFSARSASTSPRNASTSALSRATSASASCNRSGLNMHRFYWNTRSNAIG